MLQSHTTTLKVDSYQPAQFEFETTNQKNYKPYTVTQRPQTTKPKVEAVRTSAFGQHFDTHHKRDYKKHQHRVLEVDLIPFP